MRTHRGGRPRTSTNPRSTLRRGYGAAHRAERKRLAPLVATGLVNCARCGKQILPGEPWCLDHADRVDAHQERGGIYLGPSHRRCNHAAAHKKLPAQTERKQPQAVIDFFGLKKQ